MKSLFKKWLLSFDHSDETGMDYKKLTAFWFVIVSTFLIVAYSVESLTFFWFGMKLKFKEEFVELKWILGIILAFILTLIYFENSKTLSQFILKLKNQNNGKIESSEKEQS